MFQIASLKCSTCNAEIVELLVTGANNLIVFGLRRWFGVVDSSCWFVDVHCKWFQISSEEPVLTEISTVTGANNFLHYPLNVMALSYTHSEVVLKDG